MLKLKPGQIVKTKSGNNWVICEVLENSVGGQNPGTNQIHWVTKQYYLANFVYVEPFEPCEGDVIYIVECLSQKPFKSTFKCGSTYPFDKFFQTENECAVYISKILNIS